MRVLGKGVYSLTEAARLADLPPARVRNWFRITSLADSGRPAFVSDYSTVGGDRAISFLDLIEVAIAGKLRAAEPAVSLQHIRKVHAKLSAETGEKHPFCTREIYHNRGRIFTKKLSDPTTDEIIEPLTDQLYLQAVIMPFLEKIEYDACTNLARLWRIAAGVVVDPTRCFGKPIVESRGIATRILASAYEANGRDVDRVARWYEVEPGDVDAAVAFERVIAA